MKKRDSTSLAIILILLVFQLYFYLSPVSRINVSHSTKSLRLFRVCVAKSIYILIIYCVKALTFAFSIIFDVM